MSWTLRICISVAGTTDGDATIPKGYLYFALPCFGMQTVQKSTPQMILSSKEGTVTVRQMGYTGSFLGDPIAESNASQN
jgi:hypothetical protein